MGLKCIHGCRFNSLPDYVYHALYHQEAWTATVEIVKTYGRIEL